MNKRTNTDLSVQLDKFSDDQLRRIIKDCINNGIMQKEWLGQFLILHKPVILDPTL